MTDTRTARVRTYPWLIAGAFVLAFAFHRPELAVVAVPFVVGFVYAMLPRDAPRLAVDTEVSSQRVVEMSGVELTVTVGIAQGAASVEVTPIVPAGVRRATGETAVRVRVDAASPAELTWTFAIPRWGVYRLGALRLRVVEPLAGFEPVLEIPARHPLRVLPRAEPLRSVIIPSRTYGYGGYNPARRTGDGVEFAHVRPYVAGDRRQDVNWRLSSRRGGLWVTARRPDEGADVVLFLDSFTDLAGDGPSSLDAAVRLAGGLAHTYLARRDRVGVVGFGGLLQWLEPGTGATHEYRLFDTLLQTQVFASYAARSITGVPVRALPPRALIVAISPLLDERARAALHGLARFETVVVEVSAAPYAQPAPDGPGALAYRLWNLERTARRRELERAGIPVLEWDPRQPAEVIVAALDQWHRRAQVRPA